MRSVSAAVEARFTYIVCSVRRSPSVESRSCCVQRSLNLFLDSPCDATRVLLTQVFKDCSDRTKEDQHRYINLLADLRE